MRYYFLLIFGLLQLTLSSCSKHHSTNPADSLDTPKSCNTIQDIVGYWKKYFTAGSSGSFEFRADATYVEVFNVPGYTQTTTQGSFEIATKSVLTLKVDGAVDSEWQCALEDKPPVFGTLGKYLNLTRLNVESPTTLSFELMRTL